MNEKKQQQQQLLQSEKNALRWSKVVITNSWLYRNALIVAKDHALNELFIAYNKYSRNVNTTLFFFYFACGIISDIEWAHTAVQ